MTAFRPKYPDGDVEGANRMHLNIERWRVPEAWFQPATAGVDAAGLGELIENILKGFGEDERRRLVQVRYFFQLTSCPHSALVLLGCFTHWRSICHTRSTRATDENASADPHP
jgi:hypothetical protein